MIGLPEEQTLAKLVERIAPGGRLRRAWALKGGISAEMVALEIETSEGQVRRLIVRRPGEAAYRQYPRAAQAEFRLLEKLRSLGVAAPGAVYFDPSGEILPTPYLVIEYIEGGPEFAPADRVGLAIQAAEQLNRIHRVETEQAGLDFLPVAEMGCAEIARSGQGTRALAFEEERIRAALESGWETRRRSPARLVPQQQLRLLHGDYWPGNWLWRDGALAAVIDWEDAARGDPLADLAISRLDVLWIFGEDAQAAFTRHYQARMDIDYSNLPYWDLCAALRLARLVGNDLAGWAAFFEPFGRADISGETVKAGYRRFVTEALMAVEAGKRDNEKTNDQSEEAMG